jgi:hypothetical protein
MSEKTRLLELALKGLQAERAQIDDEIAQIKSQLNHQPATATMATAMSTAAAPPTKTRRMSARQKKKISEAMKRRYAAMRQGGKKSV